MKQPRAFQRVFLSTPALLAAVDQRRVNADTLAANDTVVAVRIDLPPLIANVLAVLPQTTRIAVVVGNSPLGKFWLEAMRQEFQQFSDRVKFIWFNELSFDARSRIDGGGPIFHKAGRIPIYAPAECPAINATTDGVSWHPCGTYTQLSNSLDRRIRRPHHLGVSPHSPQVKRFACRFTEGPCCRSLSRSRFRVSRTIHPLLAGLQGPREDLL
jgi:hypothetical protein